MKAQVRRLAILAGLTLVILQVACQNLRLQQQPDMQAEENKLRQTDIEWAKAASAKDVEKVASYYADDGTIYPPNAPLSAGKAAIKVAWTGMVNLPGFMVSWVPTRVEVAKSGDLGWSTGTYNLALSLAGSPPNDHGKYVAVWKKQPDGNWKVVADIFNSDLPAPGQPTQSAQQSPPLNPAPSQ